PGEDGFQVDVGQLVDHAAVADDRTEGLDERVGDRGDALEQRGEQRLEDRAPRGEDVDHELTRRRGGLHLVGVRGGRGLHAGEAGVGERDRAAGELGQVQVDGADLVAAGPTGRGRGGGAGQRVAGEEQGSAVRLRLRRGGDGGAGGGDGQRVAEEGQLEGGGEGAGAVGI